MLTLAQVKEGHHGGFFVLRGVAFEDFGDELLVDLIELEGYSGIVLRRIAVLGSSSQYQWCWGSVEVDVLLGGLHLPRGLRR